MFSSTLLNDLSQKLFAALPASLQNLEKEIQQQFTDILNATFSRMDLITREEFDVQTKVLARTREKLERLQVEVDNWNLDKKT